MEGHGSTAPQWPAEGVPANPGAWLTTVAKRRAVDQFRRNRELERKYAEIGRALSASEADGTAELDLTVSDEIDDDLLRLIFTACHPVLSMPARGGAEQGGRAVDGVRPRGWARSGRSAGLGAVAAGVSPAAERAG
ncbi:MAG TPA: hypothetical protein VFQ44_09370 [Streptosporangiaceae bacterium]|nr:hypothetical protein [Streptosporangiaceae bacterium]